MTVNIAVSPRSKMGAEVDALTNQIEDLYNAVEALGSKLIPVLGEAHETPSKSMGEVDAEPPCSPLVESLRSLTKQLVRVNARLGVMYDLLEI